MHVFLEFSSPATQVLAKSPFGGPQQVEALGWAEFKKLPNIGVLLKSWYTINHILKYK